MIVIVPGLVPMKSKAIQSRMSVSDTSLIFSIPMGVMPLAAGVIAVPPPNPEPLKAAVPATSIREENGYKRREPGIREEKRREEKRR